ncbi:hypothetical protein NFI96_004802 [Prochilodus magdalenae]|nr:hypothetical protein NFI96_004802 [Prochilodus magdalenae]
MFYQSVVASVLFLCCGVLGGQYQQEGWLGRLDRLVRKAGSVLGLELESLTPLAERPEPSTSLLNIMDQCSPSSAHHDHQAEELIQWADCCPSPCSTDRLRKSLCPSGHKTVFQLLPVTADEKQDSLATAAAINMNSADNATQQQAIAAQGALLGKHDKTLSQLAQQLQELTLAIHQLARPVKGEVTPPAPSPPPAAGAEVQLPAEPAPISFAAESGWNPEALGAMYQQGLNEDLKDELATHDPPNTLEDLYEDLIKLDDRMRERHRASKRTSRGARSTASPPRYLVSAAPVAPQPMQIGCAHLTPQEVEQCRREGRCMYCGRKGHKVAQCPTKQGKNQAYPKSLIKITVKDRYPLPLMTTAFEALQQASIFTKLDLRSAYNLVRIRQGDEWKTAFITPTGHYEYLVMPFGLMNAPAVFQRLISEVLHEALGLCVFVYLNDILIFSRTTMDHVSHVCRVLQLLLENHLYVKLEKSQFHVPSVQFLGFVVSRGSLAMDPSKLKAVAEWSRPTLLRLVQPLSIRGFGSVAAALTALTRKQPGPFRWTDAAQKAFEELKWRLTAVPILHLPDPELPFVVEVDASEVGVGAVLSQCSGQDQKSHPCAYFSHRLTQAEHNYNVGN